MKILNRYVFSILNYGCESWTWNKAMRKKVNAFEMWCYGRMLKISWKDRVRNKEILRRLQTKLSLRGRYDEEENEICRTCVERFVWFNSSTDIRGIRGGKRKVGAPRRVWMTDIMDWTGLGKYGVVKS